MSSEAFLRSDRESRYKTKYNDPDYMGEPVDARLTEGPIVDRGCTDVMCCLLFILFWAGIILISLSAFAKGDPSRVLHGMDYDGNICGVDKGYEDYKMIYFGYPFPGPQGDYRQSLSKTICVKTCPTYNDGSEPTKLDCHTNEWFKTCDITKTKDFDQHKPYLYNTTNFFDLYCLPWDSTIQKGINSALSTTGITSGIQNIQRISTVFLFVALAAVIISAIYMMLVRFCAKLMVWLIVVAFIVGVVVLGFFFYEKYQKEDPKAADQNKALALKYLAYISWGVATLAVLFTLCLISKIVFVGEIFESAAEFVASEPCTLLFPPIMFVYMVGFIIYWVIALMYIWTSGTRGGQDQLPFDGWKWDSTMRNLLVYHGISLIWNCSFITSFLQFVMAGAVVFWYFGRGRHYGSGHLTRSLGMTVRYHLGTIIYGSGIITLIQIVRLVFQYIHATLKAKGASDDNMIGQFILKCCHCCMDCFERFLRFVNTHAYIETILTGKNFCDAATDGFYLVARNATTFGLASGFGTAFIILGKLLIAIASTIVGFLLITQVEAFSSKVSEPTWPVILFAIIAYVIGSVFMEVWGIASDTILHCFLVDHEVHKNRGGARHCPPAFKHFVDRHRG